MTARKAVSAWLHSSADGDNPTNIALPYRIRMWKYERTLLIVGEGGRCWDLGIGMQVSDQLLLSLIAFATGSTAVRAVTCYELDWIWDASATEERQIE